MSVFLSMLLVCAYLVPYLITGKSSLLVAGDLCRDRFIALAMIMNDIDAEEAAEISGAATQLHPAHVFNAVPAFFSAGCFLLWMFFTPHHATYSYIFI